MRKPSLEIDLATLKYLSKFSWKYSLRNSETSVTVRNYASNEADFSKDLMANFGKISKVNTIKMKAATKSNNKNIQHNK